MHAIKAAASAPRTPVLAVGQSIEAQAGRTVITLQRVTTAAWTVTTYIGTRRIEDQCASFADEVAAGLTASAYLALARTEEIESNVSPYAPIKPGQTRTHKSADGVEVVLDNTNKVGPRVIVRWGGLVVRRLCTIHTTDTAAIWRYAALVAEHPAAA